jgi:hypothetical protein
VSDKGISYRQVRTCHGVNRCVNLTVNERERLRRDDLSRSDAGADMFATISAGYVVCVMAIVLYAKLGALVRREMR